MARRSRRLFLIAVLTTATAATGSAPTSAQSDDVVVATQSCSVGRQRPTRIVFACADVGVYADHLRWSAWGGRIAVGRGTYHFNDCEPACVSGHFHTLGVTLRLYTRRACPGKSHLYYQRATIITSDGRRTRGFVGCPV